MTTQHTPMARFTLRITAESGYKATTEGKCTPHQYSMAIAALNDAPHTSQELQAQRSELLAALKRIEGATMSMYATRSDMLEDCQDIARAAIAKAEGGAK